MVTTTRFSALLFGKPLERMHSPWSVKSKHLHKGETAMTLNYLRCGFLTIVLGFVVSMPARAQTPSLLGPCTSNCRPIGGVTTGEIVGVVVGVAAAVTIVTILV